MELTRRNIFDEIIGKGVSVYESAILTCFSFDPLYFIQYFLPKLNSINVTNIVVLIDELQYDQACEEYIRYRESSGRNIQLNFSPVRMRPSFRGVFHPKIVFLVGPKQCTALIGSGNLTYGGMTYNNEVWNAFSANDPNAVEAPIIASVWKYLYALLDSGQNTIKEQLTWMSFYSESLKAIESIDNRSSGEFRFLVNTEKEGIGQQLINFIGENRVKDITIVSPFYDKDGYALEYLAENLHPEAFLCLGDEETGIWPMALEEDWMNIFEFRCIAGKDMDARTHAKIIQIHTDKNTYVLSGSPNATKAGLGFGQVKNDEASVLLIQNGYRDFIAEMGIMAGDPVKLPRKTGSKLQEVSSSNKEVTILSCELWNGDYLLSISNDLEDIDILRKDNTGYDCPPIHFEKLSCRESIKYEILSGAASFVIGRNGHPISNRILVLVDNNIRNYCPDKTMKQLSRLMDVSKKQDWDSNITQILSFVTFEEETPSSKVTSIRPRAASSSQTPQDTVIDRKDFAASPIENDAFRRNYKVLDYFFSFISSDDYGADEIEEYDASEIDTGNAVNEGRDGSLKKESRKSSSQKINELDQYLGRLGRYYDSLCKKFDQAQQPIFLDSKNSIQKTATSKAYSSCLIAIVLLLQLAKDNERDLDGIDDSHIHRRLLSLLGRFLLIFRDTSIDGEDYLSIRMREMKRNIFVYSLVLLGHFEWNRRYDEISRLLVLNLLDMYNNDSPSLSAALDSFEHNIERYFSPNIKSLEIIRGCIDVFTKNKPTIHEIYNVSFPAVIYKKRFGFLSCSGAVRTKTPNRDSLEYEITVVSPGFKDFEPVGFHNTKKIALFELQ